MNICKLEALKGFSLQDCGIVQFPEVPRNLKMLNLSKNPIEEVPSSIGCLNQLAYLNMSGSKIHYLPITIAQLDALEKIDLSDCPNITKFPNVPKNIKFLYLGNTQIEEVPSSISRLTSLTHLSMRDRTKLKSLPTSICELKSLEELDLSRTATKVLHTSNIFGLGDCRNPSVPSSFGNLVDLKKLDLSGSDIVELPEGIKQLSNLIYLYLTSSKSLNSLPELPPCLRSLDAQGCTSLERVSQWEQFQYMMAAQPGNFFLFNNCFNLDRDAVNNIVANAQLRFQCMEEEFAVESYKSFRRADDKSVLSCFPGSEILETFKRSTNSSITVQVSPDCSNKRLLGFALCIMVDFEHHCKCSTFKVKCKYQFKTKCGEHHKFKHSWNGLIDWVEDICFESNHVILLYDHFESGIIEASRNKHFDEASFEFCIKATDSNGNKKNIEVQKCSVNILYVDVVRSNNNEDESSTDYRFDGEWALHPSNETLETGCHANLSFTQDEENSCDASMSEPNSALGPNQLSLKCDVNNRDLEGSMMEEDANDEKGLDDPTTIMRPRLKRSFSSDEEEELDPQRSRYSHYI